MADHSLSPQDPYEPTAADVEVVPRGNTQGDEGSAAEPSSAAGAASRQESAVSPLDVALSLVFKEIGEQARLATTATEAAIDLAYGYRNFFSAITCPPAPVFPSDLNK